MNNTGNWRRWTAILMILILITYGFVQTVNVSASGTGQSAEEATFEEIIGEEASLEALGGENSDQRIDESTGADEAYSTEDAADGTSKEDSLDSSGEDEDYENGQYSDQTQAASVDDNDINAIDPDKDTAAEEAPANSSASHELTEDKATEDAYNLLMAASAVTSTVTLDESNYNIKYLIQSGYQMVCFGNAQINLHTMGSVLVAGNLTEGSGSNGIADSAFSVAPSYVAGYVNGRLGFNNRQKQNPVQVLYVGSSNTISDDGKYLNGAGSSEGYNHGGTVEYNDDYINWTKMKSAMVSTSSLVASSSTKNYTQFTDWQEIKDINAGSSVTFSNLGTKKVKLEIQGSDSNFTVITIADSGTVYVPQVTKYNGQSLSTNEDNEDMPVIFNFPNATEVIVPADLTPSFGHILAPNANVTVEGGNYNGIIICNDLVTNGEGHLRNYHGDLPKPKTFDVNVDKVDQSGHPLAGAKLAVYDSNGQLLEEFTSTGSAYTINLPAGQYTLKELEAPEGYKVAAEISFTVDDNGNVKIGNSTVSGATVQMVDTYEPYVTVRKVDPEGNPLSGASLAITTKDDVVIEKFTTDGASKTVTLNAGDYILKELEAPKGYEKADDIEFSVSADGTVTVKGAVVCDITLVMVDTYTPVETELRAKKTLRNTSLAGQDFSFTLTGVSGKGSGVSKVWHAGYYEEKSTEGYYEEVYVPGYYENIWHEGYYETVQVEGYYETATWEEGLQRGLYNQSGWEWISTGWYQGYWRHWVAPHTEQVWQDGYTETVWHEASTEQVWREGGTETVWHEGYWEEVDEAADIEIPMPEGSENNILTVKNAKDGSISFGKLSFTAAGTYTYQITEVSGSYKDSSESIVYDAHTYLAVVTVTKKDGVLTASVKYTDSEGNELSELAGNASAEGVPLFINTRMPKLIIKKVNALDGDMTPELYRQVRFELYHQAQDGTKSRISGNAEDGTWQLNDEGYLPLGNSQPGTYIIREVKAPEGYMKLTDDIIITVSAGGEITLTSGGSNYVKLLSPEDSDCPDKSSLEEGDKLLTVRNYPYIEMPQTGRNSRWFCLLLGPLLIMAGAYLLFTERDDCRKQHPTGGDFPS